MNEDLYRVVAVIELGTTSIRMEIAQVHKDGSVESLDSFQQPVCLGRDTFTYGAISDDTIESCVKVLREFQTALTEYGITKKTDISALATSAVREAANLDAFLDRIYTATDIIIESIDEAEVNRLNCLAVTPCLKSEPLLRKDRTMVIEVGGGSTEILVFDEGKIISAHTYRIGSLRLQQMFEDTEISQVKRRHLMQSHIKRSVEQILLEPSHNNILALVTLGGDARFAASCIGTKNKSGSISAMKTAKLSKFTQEIIKETPDELVHRLHLAYPDAEALGPALMIYELLATALNMPKVFTGYATLREGALLDIASGGSWSDEFIQQVLRSVQETGEKYNYDEQHARTVTGFSLEIFDALQAEHRLDKHYRLILQVAALLHDVGTFISTRSHHKHSYYLIINSDIFGMSNRDINIAANVARYHRRSVPKNTHEQYSRLSREHRVAVSRLAAILRIADSMDRRHLQARRDIKVSFKQGVMVITMKNAGNISLETYALKEKSDLFRQIYGLNVELHTTRNR